jgi:hypothetical protein
MVERVWVGRDHAGYVLASDYDALAAEYGKLAPVAIMLRNERDRLVSRSRDLAMMGLQSDRYAQDADYRDAVDDLLAMTADSADAVQEGK